MMFIYLLALLVASPAHSAGASGFDTTLRRMPLKGGSTPQCQGTPECDRCKKTLAREEEVHKKIEEQETQYEVDGSSASSSSSAAAKGAEAKQKGTVKSASSSYGSAAKYLGRQGDSASEISKLSKKYSQDLLEDCQGEAEDKAKEYKKYGELAKTTAEQKNSAANSAALMTGVTESRSGEMGQPNAYQRTNDTIRNNSDALSKGQNPYPAPKETLPPSSCENGWQSSTEKGTKTLPCYQ